MLYLAVLTVFQLPVNLNTARRLLNESWKLKDYAVGKVDADLDGMFRNYKEQRSNVRRNLGLTVTSQVFFRVSRYIVAFSLGLLECSNVCFKQIFEEYEKYCLRYYDHVLQNS